MPAMTDSPSLSLRARHFMGGITDLRFGRYLSMQLLPIFYVLLLFGAGLAVVAVTALVLWLAPWWAGMAALAAAPVVWLVVAAVVRAALEFLVMAYRIMLTVQDMNEVAGHVASMMGHVERLQDRLEGITGNVEDIHAGFHDIRREVQHVRGQVDQVAATVDLARPVLRPLVMARSLLDGKGRRKA
jgi:hypothetical protein